MVVDWADGLDASVGSWYTRAPASLTTIKPSDSFGLFGDGPVGVEPSPTSEIFSLANILRARETFASQEYENHWDGALRETGTAVSSSLTQVGSQSSYNSWANDYGRTWMDGSASRPIYRAQAASSPEPDSDEFAAMWEGVYRQGGDALTRLVVADWLEEHGYPNEEHAIRWCFSHHKWPATVVSSHLPDINWTWEKHIYKDLIGNRLPPILNDIVIGSRTEVYYSSAWAAISSLGTGLKRLQDLISV